MLSGPFEHLRGGLAHAVVFFAHGLAVVVADDGDDVGHGPNGFDALGRLSAITDEIAEIYDRITARRLEMLQRHFQSGVVRVNVGNYTIFRGQGHRRRHSGRTPILLCK